MYLFILLSQATVSFKIKDGWKNRENVSSRCSCFLTGRVRATGPLLFKTTIDALLGGDRQQLRAACPSDNNARPFGKTIEYTVPCIRDIQKCSYTDKNGVQIQNADTHKANRYNTCNLRGLLLGTYCWMSVQSCSVPEAVTFRLTKIQIRMYVKPLGYFLCILHALAYRSRFRLYTELQ